jgi:hypothetical protein
MHASVIGDHGQAALSGLTVIGLVTCMALFFMQFICEFPKKIERFIFRGENFLHNTNHRNPRATLQ